MNFQVVNKGICVGEIRVIGVSISSVLLIGDTEQIVLSSITDTPPESVTTDQLIPLASEG
ncbi:spore gernimation protein GerPD [Paenibacillus sp. RC67]|uniref:spore gernimation protein GerPD n=1 Tax=Paenibacillus sp. RC67 TaxID=3039392 RepID=UPI0024AC8AB0|nr:spore gernimation protein GerPD [Paenibacillus sp. RC67]